MAKPPRPPRRSGLGGVLVVDKPSGPTSFDIVAQVRRHYGVRSVGHAGTLDPLASGVLVVMLGEATKLSEYLTAADKLYRAEITFGRSTDTLDVDGQTLDERVLQPGDLTEARVLQALERERTRSLQVPPAFSAIKQAGETAYAKARRGEHVELAARPVVAKSITLLRLTPTTVHIELRVSKGYYVRALARDVSEFLGVPACLSGLRRLASGAFTLSGANVWPPIAGQAPLISTSEAASWALSSGVITPVGEQRARQGKRLTAAHFSRVPELSPAAWLSESGCLIAVGERLAVDDPLADGRADAESTAAFDAPHEYRVLRGFQPSS